MDSRSGDNLTDRERDVLALMAQGLTNKEISARLKIGRRTVDTHVDRVMSKLNATTRTRAVAEAGRLGLLSSTGDGMAAATPPPPHNLPIQLTTLVGRAEDLDEVRSALDRYRLVTLAGSGGVGKTRLAIRAGLEALPSYPDGVWFFDLSPIADPTFVASALAKVLGIRENPRDALSDSVVRALVGKKALLVVDNCEHVLDEAAPLLETILCGCLDVRILATSRQSLGIAGEAVHRVRSLAVPEQPKDLRADDAMTFGAVEMFVDRAQASDTRFSLTDENAAAIGEICARLDGIPLAIELAASRTNVLDVHTLARRLDDRFSILTGGGRAALPRQKTLTALIDWSYDLLSPPERTLLNRLGIFSGGFALEAASAVCGGDALDAEHLIDLVTALVDKSLVVVQTGEGRERYRLLETTRAYVLEELAIAGERERIARRHAEYFRELARAADDRYGNGSAAAWLAAVEVDLENYRSAMRWALADGKDVAIGAEIAGALERLWFLGGLAMEARGWIAQGLERVDEDEHPAVAARLWRAKARFLQGEPMRESAEHALALHERVGDMRGAAYALRTLAYSLLQVGKVDDANRVINRAIGAFRERADEVGIASCLGLQGVSAYVRGDFSAGRRLYVQAVAASKALGDELATADVLGNFGELEFADGHPERAVRLVTESLAITSRGKEVANLAIDHNNRAAYCIALGRLDEARVSARDGLRWAQGEDNVWNTSVALQHLALLAALDGEPESAARIVGYVNAQYNRLGLEREATEKWAYDRLQAALGERLTPAQVADLSAEGGTWSEDQVVGAALTV